MGQECVGVAAKSLSVQKKYPECQVQVNETRGFNREVGCVRAQVLSQGSEFFLLSELSYFLWCLQSRACSERC